MYVWSTRAPPLHCRSAIVHCCGRLTPQFLLCLHRITGGIEQYCLEAATANGVETGTSDRVNVEFYVGQAWTTKRQFFHGAARGETRIATINPRSRYTLAESTPTKIRFSIDGGNGWAFWRIKFGGVIIHENPDGAGRPEYETGSRFWIDGDGVADSTGMATTTIPASITIDIPSTFSSLFISKLHSSCATVHTRAWCLTPLTCPSLSRIHRSWNRVGSVDSNRQWRRIQSRSGQICRVLHWRAMECKAAVLYRHCAR